MERLNRGLTFWVLLAVSLVPAIASGQTLKKIQKCLYTTNLTDEGFGTGSASLVVTSKGYADESGAITEVVVDIVYRAKSTVLGVTDADLAFNSSVVPLCNQSGSGAEICEYDADGFLFISGTLGDAPGGFLGALKNNGVQGRFNAGDLGSGTFVLAQKCSCRQADGSPCGS